MGRAAGFNDLAKGHMGDPGGEDAASGSDGTGTGQATGQGEASPSVRVVEHSGTFTAEAVNLGLSDTDRSVDLEDVPVNATAIIAELRWTGEADMDLYVRGPSYCPEGESPTVFDGVEPPEDYTAFDEA